MAQEGKSLVSDGVYDPRLAATNAALIRQQTLNNGFVQPRTEAEAQAQYQHWLEVTRPENTDIGWITNALHYAPYAILAGAGAQAALAGGAGAGAGAGGELSGFDVAGDAALGSGNNIYTAGSALNGAGAGAGAGEFAYGGGDAGSGTFFGEGADGTYAPNAGVGGYLNTGAAEGSTMLNGITGAGGSAGAVGTGTYAGTAGTALSALGGLGSSGSGWGQLAATLGGSLIQSNAISNAANQQAQSTQAAIAASNAAQDKALAVQQPFLQGGYAATNKLLDLLGLSGNTGATGYNSLNTPFSFTPGDLTKTPGYQFTQQQGQNALDRKAAAGGGFYSGQGLQAASQFNQDLAGTTYNTEYNRARDAYQTERANTLNPLQALAGQGQTAANTSSNVNINGGNTLASLLTSSGNAQGAASIAGGNAIAGGINNGLAAWQNANLLNKLYGGG